MNIPTKLAKYGLIAIFLLISISFFGRTIKSFFKEDVDTTVKTEAPEQKYTCTRKEPYKLAPEFERARSLRVQRLSENGYKMNYDWYNCINIVYSDLTKENAEGMFYFDKKSSLDNLTILVDNSYKAKDDTLTAILLAHELTHLGQFLAEINGGNEKSCVDKEVEAFKSELEMILNLNEEEKNALGSRIDNAMAGKNKNSPAYYDFLTMYKLLTMGGDASDYCQKKFGNNQEERSNCYHNLINVKLRDYIASSRTYQKQCEF